MYLGRVIGCVWATVKHPAMVGQRMLVIQPLTPELEPTGKRLVCLDSTVVGIVDSVHVKRTPKAVGKSNPTHKKARKS